MNDDSSEESSCESPLSSLSSSPEKRIRNRTFEYITGRRYNIEAPSIIDVSIDSREDSDLIQVYPLEDIQEETNSLISRDTTINDYNNEDDENLIFFEERKTTFSKILFSIIIISYIYGLSTGSDLESISPKEEKLYYNTISYWPECKDLRWEIWRMFTSAIVHSGLVHIFFNLLFLTPISFLLEKLQKSVNLLIITLIGCIHTSISFYFTKPYNTVIGCSNIVFILYGSFFSNNILNSDFYFESNTQRIVSFFIIIIFLLMEIFGYIFYYSENIAYLCHWVGFISGLFGGLSLFRIFVDSDLKYNLVIFSRFIYICSTLILIYNYVINYPLLQSYNERFNKVKTIDCCYEWNKYKINYNVGDEYFKNYTCPYVVDYNSFI